MKKLFSICLIVCFYVSSIASAQEIVTITEDFESGISSDWTVKNPDIWNVINENENKIFKLLQPGKIPSDIRRPGAYAVLMGKMFTDVSVSLDVRCEAPETRRGRDFVVIAGYQDDTHFYYVHFSNYSDKVHNNILMVNGAERTPLETKYRIARNVDIKFHRIRVYRNSESGLIAAYFDDMEFPVMTAVDRTLQWGTVGFGSFDDTGSFDNITISGILKENKIK